MEVESANPSSGLNHLTADDKKFNCNWSCLNIIWVLRYPVLVFDKATCMTYETKCDGRWEEEPYKISMTKLELIK